MTTAISGSVPEQIGGIEMLARYSLSSLRHTRALTSLEDFRQYERGSGTDKDWNWKILRDEFNQKEIESLFRKYDDILRLSYLSIFAILQILMSVIHICVLVSDTSGNEGYELLSVICYVLQAVLPMPIIAIVFMEKITKTYKWAHIVCSILVLIILVITDISVPAFSAVIPTLRPAYTTHTLFACYIFLPIRNNYIALGLGTIISICHLIILGLVTYQDDLYIYWKLGADIVYLFGINFIGIYYRLMNEVVTRRSFLDRRACIETTFKLNHEKNQEERLLLSILPEHIAYRVRCDIRSICAQLEKKVNGPPIRSSENLYIEEHKNVSILYADIVNYTMITTTLPPKQLVETLNDLFGKFDEASEEHQVLRIKFLGDCYYCVSGVPKPNSDHAKSCVDLGLDMISIIKDVREKRRLDIDMRIGVHSGEIMSGLIGIRKWQYDIWSKDVTIANRMESTGRPGMVHITKTTYEELIKSDGDYIIEPNYESARDPLLLKYKLDTFLVTRPPVTSEYRVSYRRASVNINKTRRGTQRRAAESISLATAARSRQTAFMDNNLMAYRQMLTAANEQMEAVIEEMPRGIIREYIKEKTISPWTLLYRNSSWERSFITQPDPLFKYFVAASLLILLLMVGIEALTIPVLDWKTIIIEIALAGVLLILKLLNWTQYLWGIKYGIEKPTNKVILFFYDKSSDIVSSITSRSILYIFTIAMLSLSSLINLAQCRPELGDIHDEYKLYTENCIPPWHLAQVCGLALMLSFLFSRVLFIFKWIMGCILTGIYLWLIWDIKSFVFQSDTSWNHSMDPRVAHTLAIIFLFFTLHWTDRQTEYRNRLDHRWKRQLMDEKDEAINAQLVNLMLLDNILPQHVANIYLNTDRATDELYHEEYDNVAVMFASLTDYKLGLDDDMEMPEKSMLRILDQLISDFDKLLMIRQTNQLKVEKIKMAGWTYMAACGLEPGARGSLTSVSSHHGPISRPDQAFDDDIIIEMVEFAASMMKQLKIFNRSSFQGTNLKIGISHGEVTAGVVGSLKPLYDIWGNAVNMASRMDSTGEAGKIQVTENTAIALDRQSILTQYRGKTFVKGAGSVRTYFVPLDSEFKLIYKNDDSYQLVTGNESYVTRC